jgi:hypothetical protein
MICQIPVAPEEFVALASPPDSAIAIAAIVAAHAGGPPFAIQSASI